MKLFVPGRLCLFGEHSDWAGEYCRDNPELEKGYAIAVGTNQGIYAEVKTNPNLLRVKAVNSSKSLKLPMQPNVLLEIARRGGFFSYVAGVAYQALTRYEVGGLTIDNYVTDLPVKKGLSSSAAICVLTARAFNRLYQLNLSLSAETELAYLGERTTPSKCGKLDLACAYGDRPILMTFDGETVDIKTLTVSQDLYFVIVDLGASKNTQLILTQLNQCYPVAKNTIQENVRKYLGKINASLVKQAEIAIQQGNAEDIGQLMQQAQREFDRYLIPACPSQLTAPVLHRLLAHPPLQPYIFGGKGVGSQGDGTAQFIAKDRACQQRAIAIIIRDFPQMQCLKLAVGSASNPNKA